MNKLILTTITEQPDDFRLLAQNMQTFEICGYTNEEGFTEIDEIPSNFIQRVLPSQYGEYLNLKQITNGLLMEEKGYIELIKQILELDYRIALHEIGEERI